MLAPSRIEIEGSSAETPLSISPLVAATAMTGSTSARALAAPGAGAAAASSSSPGAGWRSSHRLAIHASAITAAATASVGSASQRVSGTSAGPAIRPRPTIVSNRPT